MDKQIFWLASYPKSGNTLLRYILTALFFSKDGKFTFENSHYINQFEETQLLEKNKELFGKDFYRVNDIKILYKYLVRLQTKESLGFKDNFIFLKTHAGLFEINGNPFTTPMNTRGIIYILRDPRDVCLSWSKHMGISVDETIKFMIKDYSLIAWANGYQFESFSKKNIPMSLMSSWNKHVISWTSHKWNVPMIVLKYEDLIEDKKKTIKKIVSFFEKNYNFKFHNIDKKIENILITTDLKIFKKYEEESGFVEASQHSKFFSVGKKNQWIKNMSKNQLESIEENFNELMKLFNYKLSFEK